VFFWLRPVNNYPTFEDILSTSLIHEGVYQLCPLYSYSLPFYN
jgi:hypothetical protein